MRRLLTMLALAGLLVAPAPAALAKGPVEVSISGPGLATPIDIDARGGSGEPGSGGRVAELAEASGLFAVGLSLGADKLSTVRPDGDLGPPLTMTWTVPAGDHDDAVVQVVYPYADAGAVTYTEAGQAYMGMRTAGGWYQGGDRLAAALADAGVPSQPPATGVDPRRVVAATVIVCTFAALLLLARRLGARTGAADAPAGL